MISQVEVYLAARVEFIAATKELEAIGAFIREVGESLTDMLSIPTDAAAKWKSLEELKALLDRRKSLAYKMMDFWEEIPKQVQEAFNHRRRGDVQRLKEVIDEGRLGQTYYAKAWWMRRTGIPTLGSWFTQSAMAAPRTMPR